MINRDIPIKNYIKYGFIIFITLLSCIVVYIIYYNQRKYKEDIPILRNKVSEISYEDVDNFINENDTVYFYFGVVHDDNSEKIEQELLNSIDKDNLKFIYVNLTDLKSKKNFFKEFNDKYSTRQKVTNYPAFVYIKNRQIVEVVQRDDRYLEMEDISQMLELTGDENA